MSIPEKTLPQRHSIRHALAVATALLCLGILGYALHDTIWRDWSAPEKPVETAQEFPPLLAPGTLAPAFVMTSVDGQRIALADYRGKKAVLLEVFASWCPHCQASVPAVKQIQDAYAQELQIIAVNAGDRPGEPSTARAFRDQYHITYPVLDRPDTAFLDAYHISGFPTFYLIDTGGTIRWAYSGTLDAQASLVLQQEINTARR